MSILFEQIDRHAREQGDKIALRGDGESITYGALPKAIAEKRQELEGAEIKVLGLQMMNGPEWILWDLAALQAGIVCVPLPPFFSAEQSRYVMQSAGVDACITDQGLVDMDMGGAAVMPEDTAKITFTSGTTGTPKGVCLSRAGLERVSESLLSAIGLEYGERHVSVMPLGVLLENVAGVYTALLAGAEVFIPSPAAIGMDNPFMPDFAKLAAFIAEHRITSMILVPELLRGVMAVAAARAELFSSLRFVAVGGSTVSPVLINTARAMGLPVFEGYGLSECGSVVSLNTPRDDYAGTAGKMLPHITAENVDDEIVIKNPAFLGYLGEAPRGADEPFATGDIGEIGADGTLKISGRKKNIIITSQGRNIAPEWVESLLLTQPEIAQAVVYGNDLPFPAALIVPRSADADINAAVARVNEGLPTYARLSGVDIVSPFTPQNGMLTATGRPRRAEIFKNYQSIMKKETDHDILRHAG